MTARTNTATNAPPTKRRVVAVVSVVATALAGATGAPAADVDTSNWLCESCPFPNGIRGDYDVGVSHVSDDAARFGDASGLDESGAYLDLGGDGAYASDDYRMSWVLEDLGLDSRFAALEGGRPGSYDYRVAYRELPNHVFDTTATVFTQIGTDSLALPAGWVSSGLTSSFTSLAGSLRPQDIEGERQSVELGGSYAPSSRFEFSADYRHEERDGTDVVAGSFFTQASLLPRAFDFQTDDLDLAVRYAGERGHATLGYRAAWFQNQGWSVRWDNPFTAAAGAGQGRQAQPPDNSLQQVSLSGSYRFDAYDTVVTASGAVGQIEQHDTLLPYTVNPNLAVNSLPRSSLDGKIDTTNLALTLTARPHPRARVRFAFRNDERDNKTPREQWQRVITDSFDSGALETNTPYSFERMRLALSGRIDLLENVDVSAGYDRSETDRDLQEVAEQTEDGGWGSVRWRPYAWLEVSAKGGAAKRDIDRYDTTRATSLGQNPLLRKYNLAYRYREYGDIKLAASLPNAPVSFTASAQFANDDFSQSPLGMQESDDFRFAADLDWAVNEKASLYVAGGWDNIEAQQTGSEFFGAPDWRATHDDEFFTASAGLVIRGIAEKADLLIDYTRSDGDTEIELAAAGGGPSAFPALESTLDALRVRVVYRSSERLAATVQLRYESFSAKDWALAGVEPATIPTVLTLGADPYNYDVFVVGLGFSYALGERAVSLPE